MPVKIQKGPLPANHPLKGVRVTFRRKQPGLFTTGRPDGSLPLNPAANLSAEEMGEQYAMQRWLEASLGLELTSATSSVSSSAAATTEPETAKKKPSESSPPPVGG